MTLGRAFITVVAAVACAATSLPAVAGIAEPYTRPHLVKFPKCHDRRVYNRIVDRFNDAEFRAWHRHLLMLKVSRGRERFERTGPRAHEHPVRPDHGGLAHGRLIPRRYCTAKVLLERTGDELRRPRRGKLGRLAKAKDEVKHAKRHLKEDIARRFHEHRERQGRFDPFRKIREAIARNKRRKASRKTHAWSPKHRARRTKHRHRPHRVWRHVVYVIEGGQGFAGTGYNVQFCIDGLDPWRVNDGHCRVVRRAN